MPDFSQHTILVVDDEQDNLQIFSAALEMLNNATVHTASSGAEALSMVAQTHFTIIATDLSMPKMDGYALLHQLRHHPSAAGLPIIAVTAHTMAGDRERILDAGFDGYISKPFDITTLAEELNLCLQAFKLKSSIYTSPVPEAQPTVEPEILAATDSAPEPSVLPERSDPVISTPKVQAVVEPERSDPVISAPKTQAVVEPERSDPVISAPKTQALIEPLMLNEESHATK